MRRRAGRPQLKRDPLGGASMITMSHRALPRYVACVAFVALTASARAQAPVHLESDAGWSHGSVSNGALDARLEAAAGQYRSYAPVPRIAFFDLARSEERRVGKECRSRWSPYH